MNKKPHFLIAAALIWILWITACGDKADYNDFIEVNTQFIEAMDEYTSGLEEAGDALSVADAIDQFAARMETLAPEMKKLRGKYPEWNDPSKVPEELRELNEKAKQVFRRFPQTFANFMQYMRDPDVTAAMQRLQQAMAGIQ